MAENPLLRIALHTEAVEPLEQLGHWQREL